MGPSATVEADCDTEMRKIHVRVIERMIFTF